MPAALLPLPPPPSPPAAPLSGSATCLAPPPQKASAAAAGEADKHRRPAAGLAQHPPPRSTSSWWRGECMRGDMIYVCIDASRSITGMASSWARTSYDTGVFPCLSPCSPCSASPCSPARPPLEARVAAQMARDPADWTVSPDGGLSDVLSYLIFCMAAAALSLVQHWAPSSSSFPDCHNACPAPPCPALP